MEKLLPRRFQRFDYDGETTDQWRMRLLIAANDGIIPGFSLREILKIIELDYLSTEEAAIWAAGAKAMAQAEPAADVEDESLTGYEIAKIDKMEAKQIELEKAKVVARDKTTVFNRSVREAARSEELMKEAIRNLCEAEKKKGIAYRAPSSIGCNSKREGVAIWSDWHFGQEVNFLHERYNEVEARRRIQNLVEAICKYAKEDRIRKLNLFVIGDMIAGLIHYGNKVQSQLSATQQVGAIIVILKDALLYMAQNIPEIDVYIAPGNHDRAEADLKNTRMDEVFTELFRVSLVHILDAAGIKNVKFIFPPDKIGYVQTEICGQRIFAYHGQYGKKDRQKLMNNIAAWTGSWENMPRYILMGHFHNGLEDENNGINIVVNGSLVETDEYAASNGLRGDSMQKYFVLEEGYKPNGRVIQRDIYPKYEN